MPNLEDVSKLAMSLSIDERTILAHRLFDSLHEEPSPEVSEAWMKEIKRRLDDVRSGKTVLIDGEKGLAEVRRRLEERHKTK